MDSGAEWLRYLQRRAEVLKELENIKLDFCPDYQDDARVEDELQNYVDNNDIKNMIEMDNISAQRRFRYYDILDNLDVNDQLLFPIFRSGRKNYFLSGRKNF